MVGNTLENVPPPAFKMTVPAVQVSVPADGVAATPKVKLLVPISILPEVIESWSLTDKLFGLIIALSIGLPIFTCSLVKEAVGEVAKFRNVPDPLNVTSPGNIPNPAPPNPKIKGVVADCVKVPLLTKDCATKKSLLYVLE